MNKRDFNAGTARTGRQLLNSTSPGEHCETPQARTTYVLSRPIEKGFPKVVNIRSLYSR
jgi:hypothetical protein